MFLDGKNLKLSLYTNHKPKKIEKKFRVIIKVHVISSMHFCNDANNDDACRAKQFPRKDRKDVFSWVVSCEGY